MSLDLLEPVITLLEHGGPWEVSLSYSGTLSGAATDGYGGLLQTTGNVAVSTALDIRALRP